MQCCNVTMCKKGKENEIDDIVNTKMIEIVGDNIYKESINYDFLYVIILYFIKNHKLIWGSTLLLVKHKQCWLW